MTTASAVAPGFCLKTPPTLMLKPSPRLPPPPRLSRGPLSPNPGPSPRLSSSFFRLIPAPSSSRGGRPRRWPARCSADYEHERVVYPRPPEVPWRKELANTVHLIGVVGAPVQIKHVSSGKVLAWTRLGVKTSPTDTTWINLTLWDELAHVAFQHVEKGQQIYVSGRLVADSVEGTDNKRQVYYKVVVQQLNFVERTFPASSLNEPESSVPRKAGGKVGRYSGNEGSFPEELWQAFFANPTDWWDNRKNKKNPKYPDFKHKHTGEALWIEGRYNPSWVKSQLAILDSRMSSLQADDKNFALSFVNGGELTHF